jgi:hypothetical protein
VSVEQVARMGYWQDPVLVFRADPQTIWPPQVPFFLTCRPNAPAPVRSPALA